MPQIITNNIHTASSLGELQSLFRQHSASFNAIHISAVLLKLVHFSETDPCDWYSSQHQHNYANWGHTVDQQDEFSEQVWDDIDDDEYPVEDEYSDDSDDNDSYQYGQYSSWPRDRQYQREQSPNDRKLYEAAEDSAKAAKRGLWRDIDPVPPWNFRHNKSK